MEINSTIFGDRHSFAIEYLPFQQQIDGAPKNKYAICHMVFNDIVIGDRTEICYLPTWFFQLNQRKLFIEKNIDALYRNEFVGLSDREIFELILKTNEVEEEFDTEYSYLPQLSSEIWHRHSFQLDETIDGFIICYYIVHDEITFVIERVWPKSETRSLENFIFATINCNGFLKVLDATIEFLKINYAYLHY